MYSDAPGIRVHTEVLRPCNDSYFTADMPSDDEILKGDVVEVRVDGERVGKLTPKMSGDVLPAVRFLTDRGRVAAARLLVSGNRAAVTVMLYVLRAHQLDDRWFDEV